MIYVAVTSISATMALVLFILALYRIRRARKLRLQETRLENAFARARERRVHGTVRIGRRNGVYG